MDGANLDLLHLSAVREMANIGLGHATTALANVTGRPFNMDVPNVETVAIENVPLMVGDPETTTVGIWLPFEGEAVGHTAFLLPWESAQAMWTMLLGFAPQSPSEIDELAASAMLEVGNIIAGSFLNAISDMTGLRMLATPPRVSVDMAYSIAAQVVTEAEMEDVVALAMETRIHSMDESSINGFFLCIPTRSGLNLLFNRLGISEAA
jgi:chemotaxis protein CheC